MSRTTSLSRRGLLAGGIFSSLAFRAEAAKRGAALTGRGYGELQPAGDALALPAGFSYMQISHEDEMMSDGFPVPSAMDGMEAFGLPNGNTLLVRNHEIGEAGNRFRARPANSTSTTAGLLVPVLETHYGPRSFAYDAYSGGGTTSIELDRSGRKLREYWSLVGTLRNCAGGATPWSSWLSCEETLEAPSSEGYARDHGYVFEVPLTVVPGSPAPAVPLRRMGRFAHEAAAVDPATGIVYETEDQGDVSGFYRYVPASKPTRPGDLAADIGELQMLKVDLAANFVTALGQTVGVSLPVSWVRIPDPDPQPATANIDGSTRSAVFKQGLDAGGAIFRRLEGCWYSKGKIYFTSTNGGEVGLGQVWIYDPAAMTLTLMFETPSQHVLDFPDNIAISPRGGLLVCEDGAGGQYLRGISPAGEIFDFARNTFNSVEFAGACFSPDGQTLFVNIYGRATVRTSTRYGSARVFPVGSETREKALTLAIRGPWGTGLL